MFAKQSPSSVSVRDIAAEAGVNHGLVHRHFGSKDQLLTAVLDRLASRLADGLGPASEDERLEDVAAKAFAATRSQRTYWQILARVMIDGESVDRYQERYPIVPRLVAAVRRSEIGKAEGIAPEVTAAVLVATGLGVLMFEPYLKAAAGLDGQQLRSLESLLPLAIARLGHSQNSG